MTEANSVTILFVAAMPPPIHGQSAVTLEMLNRLKEADADLIVIDTSPKSLVRNLRYHAIRLKSTIRAIFSALKLSRAKTSVKSYTTVDSNLGVVYNIVIALVFHLLNFDQFFHHHTSRNTKSRRLGVRLLNWAAGPESTHIVLSSEMALDFNRLYGSKLKTRICHNAAFIPQPDQTTYRATTAEWTMGMISNLSIEKGLGRAIHAFEEAYKVGAADKLILAGPICDDASQNLLDLAQSKFGSKIVYLGSVQGSKKERFFREIDILVFPSYYIYEAQPLVLIEALSYGKPILSTDRGYISELLGDQFSISNSNLAFTDFALRELEHWRAEGLNAVSKLSIDRFSSLRGQAEADLSALVSEICTA